MDNYTDEDIKKYNKLISSYMKSSTKEYHTSWNDLMPVIETILKSNISFFEIYAPDYSGPSWGMFMLGDQDNQVEVFSSDMFKVCYIGVVKHLKDLNNG